MSATAAARSLRRVGVEREDGRLLQVLALVCQLHVEGHVRLQERVQRGFVHPELTGVGDGGHRNLEGIELRPRGSDLGQDVGVARSRPRVLTRPPRRNGLRAGQNHDRDRRYKDQQEKDHPDPWMPLAAIRHDARFVLLRAIVGLFHALTHRHSHYGIDITSPSISAHCQSA